jgi:hypothetical protein
MHSYSDTTTGYKYIDEQVKYWALAQNETRHS